ncbi:MAG: hypothetical protein GF311_06810 [Candidatus Lokiarchaeota archaeon]|nr:hypothetical protein [Candidatus Lokiarchaeota archaeon]
MEFDLSSFKVLIKKIFPPHKCVYTIDTSGDGTADSILIRAVNVVIPIEIPEELDIGDMIGGQMDSENLDFSSFLTLYLDEEQIKLPKNLKSEKSLTENFSLYHKDQKLSFNDLVEGKFGGRTIGLGDKIDIVLKVGEKTLNKLTEGKHTLTLESSSFPSLDVHFNLSEDNFNRIYSDGELQ